MYLPASWPPEVPPPASEDFASGAVSWLLDLCPPDFRSYEVLRRHPRLLARLAGEQLAAAVEGCRQGYRTARAELGPVVAPEVLSALLGVYEREGRRLAAAATSVAVVASALNGERFRRPL